MNFDFLGRGIKYPFSFDTSSGGVKESSEHAHINESIMQILGTYPGERFMRPEFGCRLQDLVFEPNDQVLKGLVRHYVVAAIKRWEKRVVVTGVSFIDSAEDKDQNLLRINIAYRVIQTQKDGNLVFPFYREPRLKGAPSI